MLLISENTEN